MVVEADGSVAFLLPGTHLTVRLGGGLDTLDASGLFGPYRLTVLGGPDADRISGSSFPVAADGHVLARLGHELLVVSEELSLVWAFDAQAVYQTAGVLHRLNLDTARGLGRLP